MATYRVVHILYMHYALHKHIIASLRVKWKLNYEHITIASTLVIYVAFCGVQTAWKNMKISEYVFVAHFSTNRRKRKGFHCCRVIIECCVAYISYIKYIIIFCKITSKPKTRHCCVSRVVCLLPIYIAFFKFFKPNKSPVCICTFLFNLF